VSFFCEHFERRFVHSGGGFGPLDRQVRPDDILGGFVYVAVGGRVIP
jgi:hypothetical protein